ncbi:hypothetical protein C2E21_5268 [Chlorella sorokiniana]|uniref:Uncharacterized protein n=1 Tax=Chlorella sorokiniana TaxID=3076 RepID=A0A2P6TPZ8_CHLSO|nr:hypothetical protein C2E21_5268 [Chlorella sorokiniana]|eukprot:PRW56113.1 hypothetical protein C2E21_5268 [Chlorella sorokiniana]
MRSGRATPRAPGEAQPPGGTSPAAARPRSAAASPASTTASAYCVVYSSDDSLSDGELHVERRAGSVSAWYQRGSGPRPARLPVHASSSEPDCPHSSLRVVVHDHAGAEDGSEDEEEDYEEEQDAARRSGSSTAAQAAAAGEGHPPPGVTWETNNLFDYLKGLYQQGVEDAQQGAEFDSEEWARRTAALRGLLRERDAEVAQLQRLLDEQGRQLAGREMEAAQQAQRIATLEQRICALLGQLEAAQAAAAAGVADRGELIGTAASPYAPPPLQQKSQLAVAYQQYAQPAAADSYFVQLPAQSYAEHQGCGFWEGLCGGLQQRPWRLVAAAAALLLLLLIILCATLIPAARRRAERPQFVAAPTVAAAGASWVDLTVQLDRPGLVSWMAFRQADLDQQVPGEGRTLLQLIQDSAVDGAAVFGASAPSASLDPAGVPHAGLQHLAVGCGWAPVPGASGRVSLLSASGGASAACTAATADSPGRCARCPKLEDSTAYTLLLAPATATARGGRGVGAEVAVVNAATGDASVNVNSLEPPFADNATATAFDLHFKLNAPGTLFYAVAYDTLLAPLGASQLAFRAAMPPSAAVISASPSGFVGGLVAAGNVLVSEAGQWATARVEPPCVGDLCQLSLHALQGSTAYRVFLVAVDSFGVADPVPAVVIVTTAAATAPVLLSGSGPSNISDSGFAAAASMDAAGGLYYLLAAPKPGSTAAPAADVVPGKWAAVDSWVEGGSRRRLLSGTTAGSSAAWGAAPASRQLLGYSQLANSSTSAVSPGSLVAPVCYPANQTCSLTAAKAFAGVQPLTDGQWDVLASGCMPVTRAGAAQALPPFTGLQNNTLYYLLLGSEDSGVPLPNRAAPVAAYAIRTVDLSAPAVACGFPVATNITATSFALSALLTKPGASVWYVVLPAAAAGTAPSALEVLQGKGSGGVAPAAAGNLTRWGSLPWEADPGADGSRDARKLWASVGGLQGGGNYTAFLTVSLDGTAPAPGAAVLALSGILTPAVTPPTFTRLKGLNASMDEAKGTFSVQLSTDLDRAGQVYYALYRHYSCVQGELVPSAADQRNINMLSFCVFICRNYSCIQGEPSAADVVAGAALPSSICKCEDRSYCALVTAGNFSVPAQTLGAVHGLGGDLSALPFQSLRNATDAQLKCFQGGLGQATDTYNIYLVAANALPTYTGLAPQCSNFAQAAAVAAAAGQGTAPDASCPAARQLACSQAQLRPDSQATQSGAFAQWPVNGTSGSTGSPVVWQPPSGSIAGHPAKVQLSLEGGTPPAFTYGPAFPAEMRAGNSFGMRFALDKPALLIYAVFRVLPIDASGKGQAPVLIATGRVPVFDAATNATTGAVSACPWAPGGAMTSSDQLLVTYVARDKYGRMDGLCPGQTAGDTPRVCTQLAFT